MATARKWVEERCKPKERTPTSTHMPLSHEAKRVLAYGAEESERLGHKEINCLHLVLGVLREKRSLAAEFLRENGIARDQFIAGLLERPEPSIPGLPATGPLAQRLAAVVAAAKPRLAGISEEVAMVSPQSFEAMGRIIDLATAHHPIFARALAEPRVEVGPLPLPAHAAAQNYHHLRWYQLVELWFLLHQLLVNVLSCLSDAQSTSPCRICNRVEITLAQCVEAYVQEMEANLRIILMGD